MQFVTNVVGHVDKTWGWMKIKLLSEIDNTNAIDCMGRGGQWIDIDEFLTTWMEFELQR